MSSLYVNRPYDPNRGSLAIFNPPTTAAPTAAPAPIHVGIEAAAYEAVLYGKVKPLFVGGEALMGGRIIEGPFYGVDGNGDPTVSAIYYLAEAANPTGTRTITELRVRGAVASFDGSGFLTDPQFSFANARAQFRTGTRTQAPFDGSIARYGSGAIAYRQGIVISLTDFPLRTTNGIIPMLSGKISDSSFGVPSDGITRKDAIEVLLRYARLSDTEIEVDVPGSDPFWIAASQSQLLEFVQNLRRLFVNWNITYSDNIRIIQPSSFTIDIEVTKDNHVLGSMQFVKTDPLLIPRRKNYTYIDVERDSEPNVVSAQEDLYPAPSTSSVNEENIELPIGTTSAQATADVNVSLYEELAARSQVQATLQPELFAVSPGDVTRVTDSRVHSINFVGRAFETKHDLDTFRTDVNVVEVLNCGVTCDPIPDDAVAVLDFLCPQYWVEGVFYEEEDVIGGTGAAEIIRDIGLLVDGVNGSYPRGIGAFLTKWAAMLTTTGLTVIVEFKPFDAAGELDVVGTLFMTRNTGDTRNFWAERNGNDLQVSAEAIGGSGNWNIASGNTYTPNAVNTVAITFLPDPADDDAGKLAISLNGGAVDTAPSGTKFATVDILEIGHQYEMATRVSRYIRKITVREPVDDADLPGLRA